VNKNAIKKDQNKRKKNKTNEDIKNIIIIAASQDNAFRASFQKEARHK